jgi:predicted aspartyl protease
VQSSKHLRDLYRLSAADRVSAEALGMLTSRILASSAAKESLDAKKKKVSHMMFSGRAAAAKANILFDTGASNNFVLKKFAKQTSITIRPVEYCVCLADDKTTEVAVETHSVCPIAGISIGHVKCCVMDMLYEVDLILGEEFLDKYDCILHYGKGCFMIH